MSQTVNNDSSKKESDPELDDLLDSALEDFEKSNNAKDTDVAQALPATNIPNPFANEEGDWNEEFLAQAKKFDEQMAALFTESGVKDMLSPDEFNEGLQKISNAAAMVSDGNVTGDVDPKMFNSITQALKGLKEGSDNLQAAPQGLPDMSEMFSGLQLTDDSDSNPFLPFVQGMMQSLLSAEVLLPSLKELLEKYPKWLAENSDKIDVADKERYIKQQDLFKVICADLENEKLDDTTDVKNERFKKVLENMQKLHEYGQPPAELIGADGANLPPMPSMTDPSQCSIM